MNGRDYPGISSSVAEFFDERLHSSHLHIALWCKANNSPRSKFCASADFLPNQVPDTILRSQQALLLGGLVVLDLWSRKDTSCNESGLRFDLDSPFHKILHVNRIRKEGTLFLS